MLQEKKSANGMRGSKKVDSIRGTTDGVLNMTGKEVALDNIRIKKNLRPQKPKKVSRVRAGSKNQGNKGRGRKNPYTRGGRFGRKKNYEKKGEDY